MQDEDTITGWGDFSAPTRKRPKKPQPIRKLSCLAGCGCLVLPLFLVGIGSAFVTVPKLNEVTPKETAIEPSQEPEKASQAPGTALPPAGKEHVHGYTRKDGKVVKDYNRKW